MKCCSSGPRCRPRQAHQLRQQGPRAPRRPRIGNSCRELFAVVASATTIKSFAICIQVTTYQSLLLRVSQSLDQESHSPCTRIRDVSLFEIILIDVAPATGFSDQLLRFVCSGQGVICSARQSLVAETVDKRLQRVNKSSRGRSCASV